MATFGQYLANFAYDLIFFSSDVQTTTIAMAITGSLCYTIMWAIVHIITLIHDPPIPGATKSEIVPTGLSTLSRQNSFPHKQTLQKSLMTTSSLDIVCIRCGRLLSDQRCRYGMCAGCCLGRRQCQVHQTIPTTSSVSSEVSMGLRISGPKGLDFSNNSMQSVPERLGFVGAQLTFLNLSGNNLTELPPDIGCLQGLRELQISDNKLINIPVTIGTLSNLCELDLRNNQLSNIPGSLPIDMATFGQYLANFAYDLIFFSSDVQTTTIAMAITGSLCYTIMWAIVHIITLIHDPPIPGATKSEIVPTGLSTLSRQNSFPHKQTLQKSLMTTSSLDIVCIRCGRLLSDQRCRYGMCAGCCLGRRQCQVHQTIPTTSSVSSEVSMGLRISGPKGLDFSNNSMQSVPERLGFVGAQLTFLNLSGNNLTELPPDIGCLQGLRELQISDNKLINIPVTIGTLSNLCELDLRNNQLSNIPETLWQLSSLKYLNLEYNQLSTLSSLVCRLILLEELYLGSNCLTTLPSSIGKLFNLKLLSVRHNPLSNLPPSVGQLICLDQLDLVHCHLTSLPQSLGHCLSLRKLSLCHNRLSYLPSQLCQLQRLRELYVTNNSLSSFPASMENMALNMFEISGNPLITSDTTVVISSRGSAESCTFPPLMELVARQIVYKKIGHFYLLPHSLQEYLRSRKQCSWCRGPVFQYYRSHIRHGFVGKYHILVPLKETLCSPHLDSQCQHKYSHNSRM